MLAIFSNLEYYLFFLDISYHKNINFAQNFSGLKPLFIIIMQFDSFLFLIFFATVLSVYHLLPNWKLQKLLLLLSSYIFYAAWSPPLIILLWFSTLLDFYLAKKIYQTLVASTRKRLLLLSLIANLGILGYFKYSDFLINSFRDLLLAFEIIYVPPDMDIILPIGISFYTFQTISYTIDIYRGALKPTDKFLDFALYVTFFPQLVAGPIVRAKGFLAQCFSPRRATLDSFFWGISLFVSGIFLKLVLADFILAPVVDKVYSSPGDYGWFDSWTVIFAFSGQIYFDFAGYSLCAIGSALCFGFQLPDNFRTPYGSIGFSDFWSRWHISLSSWLRDYLYIPLGGSRKGIFITLSSLLITMFLGGLWHGAAWTFVIWGWLHGFFLVGEHLIRIKLGPVKIGKGAPFALIILTFFMVSLAWIPFRSQDFATMREIIKALFRLDTPSQISTITSMSVILIVVCMTIWHALFREMTLEKTVSRIPPAFRALLFCVLIVSIGLCSTGDSRAFIYFQF